MDKIDRYEIIKPLEQQGGMAEIYLARDPNLDREVVIKVMPRHLLNDPTFVSRFEQEAKILGRFSGESAIVPVYGYGKTKRQQPYLVMPYLEGGSLAEWITEGGMSLEQTYTILKRIAQALDTAHNLNIIHRDVKPSNILFDKNGKAYLSDFGIANLAELGTDPQTGTLLGTADYMPPEQWDKDQEVVPASDIYAVGIVLYEMLAGRTPYGKITPVRLMNAHLKKPLPPLSDYRSDLPSGIEKVIEKATAKKSAKRIATANELLMAFDKAMSLSRQPHRGMLTWKWLPLLLIIIVAMFIFRCPLFSLCSAKTACDELITLVVQDATGAEILSASENSYTYYASVGETLTLRSQVDDSNNAAKCEWHEAQAILPVTDSCELIFTSADVPRYIFSLTVAHDSCPNIALETVTIELK